MAVRGVGSLARGVFDALLRPQRFVELQTSTYESERLRALSQVASLVLVYVVNLVAYAVPLTLAGIGVQSSAQAPSGYAALVGGIGLDPTGTWQLLVAFVQNSLYITVATVVTLVTFHVGVVLARDSRGVVQSMHTVVYTTSAYLVAVFTGVWYLTNQAGVDGARELVLNLQAAFVYAVIDLIGADLSLPVGRPDSLVATSLSTTGQVVLALLVVAVLYYLFSLYLGARVNHLASRRNAALAVLAVALAPVVYVAGSVLAYTVGFA